MQKHHCTIAIHNALFLAPWYFVTHFGGPHKQKIIKKNTKNWKTNAGRKQKKYINKKNILECPGNCWILVEKDQIYKIKKFSSAFSIYEGFISKENLIWGGNLKLDV